MVLTRPTVPKPAQICRYRLVYGVTALRWFSMSGPIAAGRTVPVRFRCGTRTLPETSRKQRPEDAQPLDYSDEAFVRWPVELRVNHPVHNISEPYSSLQRFWIEPGFHTDQTRGWQWETCQVRGGAHHAALMVCPSLPPRVGPTSGVIAKLAGSSSAPLSAHELPLRGTSVCCGLSSHA